MDMYSVFTHWLPRISICPVNGFPDFIYIEITEPVTSRIVDLYQVRKIIQRIVPFGRKAYMEDIAREVSNAFPYANRIVVRLAFNRHRVVIERAEDQRTVITGEARSNFPGAMDVSPRGGSGGKGGGDNNPSDGSGGSS